MYFSTNKPRSETTLHFAARWAALDWITQCNDHNVKFIGPHVDLLKAQPDILELTLITDKSESKRRFQVHLIEVELSLGNIKPMTLDHYRVTEDLDYPDLATLIVPYNLQEEVEASLSSEWQIATVRPANSTEKKQQLQFDWVRRKNCELPWRPKSVYRQTKRRIDKAWKKAGRNRLEPLSFDQDIDFQELFDELE